MSVTVQRLAELQEQLLARLGEVTDPAEIERQLRARAQEIAAPPAEDDETAPAVYEAIVVRRGRALLGLPLHGLVEIGPADAHALPHATDVLQGLFLRRGRVHCLADVGPLVDPGPVEALPSRPLVALLAVGRHTLGIRVDEVLGPRRVRAGELDQTPRGQLSDFVVAVTRDGVTLLDVGRLLGRPEMLLDLRA